MTEARSTKEKKMMKTMGFCKNWTENSAGLESVAGDSSENRAYLLHQSLAGGGSGRSARANLSSCF